MNKNMKDIGKTTKNMEQEFLLTKMVQSMREILKMIKKMG